MRDETEKTIYGRKKANNLSTHGGSEGGIGCSWEEKTKAIGTSLRNSFTKLGCVSWNSIASVGLDCGNTHIR